MFKQDHFWIGGDFNFSFDTQIDMQGSTFNNDKATAYVRKMEMMSLLDVWRTCYKSFWPKIKPFMYKLHKEANCI